MENFSRCPISLIESALDAAAVREWERADRLSSSLGIFGVDWLVSKTGDRHPDPDRYNPYGKFLRQREARKYVPPDVAKTFHDALPDLPPWVRDIVDVDLVNRAK